MQTWLENAWTNDILPMLSHRLPEIAIALAILVGGWLLAYIIRQVLFAALKRTTIDDKVAELLGVETGGEHGARVERIMASGVYYILLLFVLVAFFGYLKIDAVTKPLLTVLDQFAGAVPNLVKAVVVGFGGFLLATGVRKLIVFALDKIGFEKTMQRLAGEDLDAARVEPAEEEDERRDRKKGKKSKKRASGAPAPITHMLADVAYWFVIIVAAIPVLESLQIGALAGPLQAAFATVTTYLPKVAAAIVLMIAGYVLARVVRAVVTGVLERVGVDTAMNRLGFAEVTREQKLSGIVGTIAMVFILLQFAISAVGRLEIREISQPLGLMLEQIYAYLPKILVGGVLLAIGVLVARVATNVTSRLLAAMGFNTLMVHIGIFKHLSEEAREQEATSKHILDKRREGSQPASVRGSRAEGEEGAEGPASRASGSDEADELLGQHGTTGIQTPADVAGVVVGAIVVLLFLRQVLNTMQLEGLGHLLDGLLAFLPNALVAVVVLGAGLWAGGWARRRIDELTRTSEDRLLKVMGAVANVIVVVFAVMVALQQLGVGEQLIAIAFGLVLGAVCLALALAFGLGGREVAARILEKEYRDRQRPGPK